MTDETDRVKATPDADAPATLEEVSQLDAAVLERYGADLIKLVVRTIEYGLARDSAPHVAVDTFARELRVQRATFVTLERDDRLRGCIGSVIATRSLVEDVVENAFRAAFRDPRFPPLSHEERKGLGVSLSVLSPMARMAFQDEDELRDALRPGTDGLLIEDRGRRAVFLPQVWDQLPEPADFLAHLKEKAGMAPGRGSDEFRAWRFVVQKVPPLGLRPAAGP